MGKAAMEDCRALPVCTGGSAVLTPEVDWRGESILIQAIAGFPEKGLVATKHCGEKGAVPLSVSPKSASGSSVWEEGDCMACSLVPS